MRFGLRSLQACVLLASAAVAAFADTPSSAAAGSGAAQEAVAPAGQAGEKTVQEAVALDGKTAHSTAIGALAPVKRPPVTPSVNVNPPPPTAFFTVTQCRVFDTRLPANAPALQTGVARTIQITGNCGIPTSAKQVAVNATVTQQTSAGSIELYPGDGTPTGLALNDFLATGTRANNAVAPLALNGNGTIDVLLTTATGSQSAHFFLDISGYFAVVNPIAVNDSYNTTLNTALNQPAPGVLANDTLNGGSIFSYGATTGGEQTTIGAATPTSAGGSITLNADGSFNYTPATGFQGSDTFKYVLKNTFGSSTATVTIVVDAPPTVTSTNPTNGASSVPASTTVTINFSKAVNVTAPGFKLECPSGTPVAFTLAPAAPGGVATFTLTPSANLPSGVTCTATAVAAQIKDLAGTNMAADYVFSFTTGNAPAVTSTVPTNGATAVLASTTITINFNHAVNVTATAFKLECPTGSPTAFTLSPAPPGNSATFTLTPSAPLPAGTTCTVTVAASQVTDAASVNMAADYVFSFTVDTPPTVTSTSPVNGATAVPLNTTVTFNFNKAVNVTAPGFKLECPSGTPVAFTLAPAAPGGVATFTLTPSANLPSGVTCTATAVAAQIKDLAGTNMAADYVFTFTTDTAPTVSSTAPTSGATSVALNATVGFTFDRAVNITPPAFKLECPSGTPVAFSVSPAAPGGVTTFTLTPSAPLPASTVCTATAVAAQIKDLAGTNMAVDFSFSFTTDTPPAVTTTVPTGGAINISPSTTVTINFSKTVNVTASAFKLECPAGTPKSFTISPVPPGGVATFTLTPSAPLPVSTTCTVTAVAAQIADTVAGTHMTADYVFTFTTGTPPTVASTSPANGATAVLASTAIGITFNRTTNVTASAFKLECPTGTPKSFTISPVPPGGVTTFTLTPSAALPAGTTCTVTVVASQTTDAASGVNMAADYVFSFTVDTPPTVTSTSPVNGATTVPLNTTVTFNFSKAVNVTASAFKLECPTGTPVAFGLSPSPPGGATAFTLTPSANLPAGTTCTATAVASQITDLAGTHLAADFAFSFTTDTPPAVTTTVPTNGAASVLASTTVTINFNKAVNVTASAFKLECPTGTPETFSIAPAPPGGATSFTLTPSANLPAGAVCTATVVANQVTDGVGTQMAADFTFSFTIDTPPTVSSTNPANGTNSVPLNSTISITFSKPVNVTGSAFTLVCSPGSAPSFTVTPANPATTFVLHPGANLPFDSSCTVTVVANQVTDVPGTQMVSNYMFSFEVPPIANNDTYPAPPLIGNISINSSLIGFSVTANDSHNSPITITAFDATSAHGGTVSMTTSGPGIGQFTYNPKAGYTGADSFTYTISNANGSSTATVSLTLSGIIWFIDASAGAGDGRLSSPFNSLASFQAVNDGVGLHPAANANIFLYDNASAYTGPVTLLNGQKLIGQDATSSLSAISGLTPGASSAALPATGGGSPNKVSITATGNDVTLGSGNTVWGMTLGNATSGIALSGSSVGSLKLRDLTINTTGAAVSLASGALDAILNAVSSGGGTHGISLTSTTGSFDVEGGGASDPANTTKGRTTAKNGGGTLALGSGGTIQSATGAGVLLSSATNVTLRNMVIQNNGSGTNNGFDGINATNGSALVLDNDLIQGQTGNNGVHATGVAGTSFQHTEATNNASAAATGGTHVWNVRVDNGTGTWTAANSLFHNSLENIFGISQTGSNTMTLNVTNSQFSDTATTASGNDGLQVNLANTSNVTLSVDGSTFLRNRTNGVQYNTTDSAGGGSFTVTNSSFDQNAIDVDLFHQGTGKTVSFNISNNSLRQAVGGLSASISVTVGTSSTGTTVLQGKILNNLVGNSSVVHSGSMQGSGIALTAGGAGTLTATVDGNTVVQVDNEGLNAVAAQGTGTMNLTVTNNHFSLDNASPNSDFGAMIVDGGFSGDSQTLCLHMSGNTDTGNGSSGGSGVALLTEVGTPTFNIQGYGGAANNASAIASFIDGANTDSPTPALVSPGAGTMKAAPSNCPTPP
jgi:methionine-rich copper-binding protein CopC